MGVRDGDHSGVGELSTGTSDAHGRPRVSAAQPDEGGHSAWLSTRIVIFAVVGLSFNFTSIFQGSFSVLLKPMQSEFGGPRTGLTLGFSVALIFVAIGSSFSGRLIDRFGQRRVLPIAIPALSAALCLFWIVPPYLPAYIVACAIVGLIGSGSYQFAYFGVLPFWFDRRLGLALGLAGAGISFGQAIIPIYTEWLLEAVGWRLTYVVLALTSAAVALPNLLLYPGPPQQKPHEHGGTPGRDYIDGTEGLAFSAIVKSVPFWQLAVSYALLCMMTGACFIHFVPMLTDRGIDTVVAVKSLAFLGAAALAARVSCGALLAYFNGARLGGIVFLLGCVGAWMLVWSNNRLEITLAVILLGTAVGAEGELLNYMARRVFGLKSLGTVLGALNTAFLIGFITGPLLLSIAHDLMGNYFVGQVVLIVLGLIASALHFSLRSSASAPKTHSLHERPMTYQPAVRNVVHGDG